MVLNARYKKEIERNINFWFHTPKRDSIAPDETIIKFCDLFLEYLHMHKFTLCIPERTFRLYMCEAICRMYEAKKRDMQWIGPLSEKPRPEWWNAKYEFEWKDNLTINYLNSDFFESIWKQIEEGLWEAILPNWRTSFEHIVIQYVSVRPDLIDNAKMFETSDDNYVDDYYSDQ